MPGVELHQGTFHHKTATPTTLHASWELLIAHAGEATLTWPGGSTTVGGGDVAIIPPEMAHRIHTDSELSFCALRIDVDELGVTPLSGAPSNRVSVASGPRPQVVLDWLCDQLFADADPCVHRAALLGSLAVLLQEAKQTGKSTDLPESVDRMLAHIRSHLGERITSEDLGRVAELSHYHAARTFRKHVGLPPHEYHTILRVERAKSLLATGMSVSEAASSLGFTDQSHLHRYFKRYVRVTPGEYRRWSATERKDLHDWPGPTVGHENTRNS